MVSKKSIYYGRFNGFQSPVVPKAPRSIRRNLHKKSSEGSKLCAFDLLAAVADKLLQESESCTSSIGQDRKEQISISKDFLKSEESEVKVSVKDVRSEHLDQGSCVESESPLKELSPQSDNDSGLEHVSEIKTSDFITKIGNNVKLEPCDFNLVNSITELQPEAVEKQRGELTFIDPVASCVNNSYSSGFVKKRVRDDDENSFKCNHSANKMRAFRSQSKYRRIRKMLTSRYRKLTSKKDYELTNTTIGETTLNYENRQNMYRKTEGASKRRKLFHRNSSSGENISKSYDASNKVKFSIKSFKVPELYVEIPETATIGSLKRTVMEAITAFLGDDLHVGIHLEGKKVKDNNRTLQQSGISQNCDLETLGFSLEPRFPQISRSISKDINELPLRSAASPVTDVLDNIDDKIENREIAFIPLQSEVLTEEKEADSKALMAVKTEPLAVKSVNHQPTKKSDMSQRRIRRPFSVSEVEALVEAVETLGTGRWRDVKLRNFDDANHRTYVDLKDKWKTLVHTASIGPQQRRGEPVPQILLDRVLAAHGYWSQHQIKQQRKHQNEPLRILNGSTVEFV